MLLAFCLLLRHWRLRQDVAALRSGEHPALRVTFRMDDKGHALIMPVLGLTPGWITVRPIARFAVAAAVSHAERATADAPAGSGADKRSGNAERLLPPPGVVEDAVLLGSPHDRGVAMLITSDAVLLPAGRLRAGGVLEPPSRGSGGGAKAGGGRGGRGGRWGWGGDPGGGWDSGGGGGDSGGGWDGGGGGGDGGGGGGGGN